MGKKEHEAKEVKKYHKGEIAKIILKSLLVGGGVLLVLSSPYAAQLILNYFKGDRRKFARSVAHLKKAKYVRSYYKDGAEVIEITEKGKVRSLRYDFDGMKIKVPKRFDGIWRIVMYDIQEHKKRSRDTLAGKLKDLGFYQYQKSIFILPFQCKDEIDFMREHFFLGDSIHYIEATHVDNEDELKKKFELN